MSQNPDMTQISQHQAQLMAQALGECFIAAGMIAPGTELTGPQLLALADDLKTHLHEQNTRPAECWRWVYQDGSYSQTFEGQGPDPEIEASAKAAELPRTVQRLFT
ncbi:TPA: hypothetical protein NIA45_004736 [Pseudomonas aeruginosa]|nr:hypothetical protein [Pseudomonas aeruginosa]